MKVFGGFCTIPPSILLSPPVQMNFVCRNWLPFGKDLLETLYVIHVINISTRDYVWKFINKWNTWEEDKNLMKLTKCLAFVTIKHDFSHIFKYPFDQKNHRFDHSSQFIWHIYQFSVWCKWYPVLRIKILFEKRHPLHLIIYFYLIYKLKWWYQDFFTYEHL